MLEKCHNYLKLPINDKIEEIKSKRQCFNCLFLHNVANCKQRSHCFCKKKHHQSIHFHKEMKSKYENNTTEKKPDELNNFEIFGHREGPLLNPNARSFNYNAAQLSTETNFVGTPVNCKAKETLINCYCFY